MASNCNHNVGQPYYIYDSCKMTKEGYRSYKTIGKLVPIILIAIFYP